MKIIAIDGVCRAGKSTVIKALTERRPEIGKINEYSDYGNNIYPDFPPASPQIQIENVRTNMFALEEKRLKDLKKLHAVHTVLLDRCYVTSCAFDYAASSETGFNVAEQIESVWISNQNKIQPDKIVILDVEYEEQMRRLKPDINRFVPILYNQEFNFRFRRYMKLNATKFTKAVTVIDTTTLTPSEVYQKVLTEL